MTDRDLDRLSGLRQRVATGEARRLREDACLTRAEVAASIGINYRRLQKWELGDRTPAGPEALRYARLLDRLAQRTEGTR